MQFQLLTLFALLASSQLAEAGDAECPQLSAKYICNMAWPGFSYDDGCNGIRCGTNGSSLTTLKMCERAAGNSDLCAQMEDEIYQRLALDRQCKQLTPKAVCATAPQGLRFNDGCNSFICDGAGSASGTLRACDEAKTKKENKACDAMIEAVATKLPQVTCQLNATEICKRRGSGFYFNNGCNGVTCAADGTSASTLMYCPPADENSLTCQLVRKRMQPRTTKSQGRSTSINNQAPYSCRNLAAEKICTQERIGFSYNDGCNNIVCTGQGVARSSRMYCPEDNAKDEASVAFCTKAEEIFNKKLTNSKRQSRCLTPSEVCTGKNPNKYYYDGCNYCQCFDTGRAGCTRMACRSFFGSDDEFKKECVRRKARVIGNDDDGGSA